MPSPFPGMDPYTEASGRWEDFHTKFIGEIERTLSPLLPARYAIGAPGAGKIRAKNRRFAGALSPCGMA